MGKAMVGLLALVIGLVAGAVGGGSLIGGTAMGIGAGTGLSAGICATVQAAQEEGLMTAEQVDQVLARAAKDLAGADGVPEDVEMVGGAADCVRVMENLKKAAG